MLGGPVPDWLVKALLRREGLLTYHPFHGLFLDGLVSGDFIVTIAWAAS